MARITQELKTETKDNIIKTATEMFSEKGFDHTKTKLIAQKCGIAEGTLFNYFPTKDDLLIAVFEHMVENGNDITSDDKSQVIDRIVDAALTPIDMIRKIPNKFLFDLLISSLKISRKKPRLFHKLAALDMKYIERLQLAIETYGDFSATTISSVDLAEMMYGVVATQFMLHLYRDEKDYQAFTLKVSEQLKAMLKPYLKEVVQ